MRNRLTKMDRRILSAALLLLLGMLYLMYDDSSLFSDDRNSSLTAIGKIETTQLDVRRKVFKQFTWKTIHVNDTINQGDSFFTGEGAKATIRLNDGRTLIIGENSMIVFNHLGNQLHLDLKFGKVNGTISGCMKVDAGGKTVDVCGQDQKVEIDADGAVQAEHKPPALKVITWAEQPPAMILHNHRNTALNLSWKSDSFFTRYRLQIAKDADFKNVLFEETATKKTMKTHGYPSEGNYFARIRGEDLKGRPTGVSAPTPISFQEVAGPVITNPTENAVKNFKTTADGALDEVVRLKIEWTFKDSAHPFEVELSKTSDFKEPATFHNVMGHSLLTPILQLGKYYVRVRTTEPLNNLTQPWSEITPFTIALASPYKLQAPALLTKKIHYIGPAEKDPYIAWLPVVQAQKYIVQVSNDPSFANKITLQSKDTRATIHNYSPGLSYFRVLAATDKGAMSPASETGELQVMARKPVLTHVEPIVALAKTLDDPGDPQKFKLSWSDNKLANSYVVQVSKDPGFHEHNDFVARGPASEIVVKHPGEVFWRVKALDDHGQPLSHFSDKGNLNYILKVPLVSPALVEPVNDVTLYYQKNAASYVWLEWNSVKDASFYMIEIAADKNFEQKIVTAESPSPHYLVKDNLPSGKLYWRVRAMGDFDRKSWWSDAREMNVYSGRTPAGE